MEIKTEIEKLNNFKTIKILYGNIYQCILSMHIEQLKNIQKAIELVLNELERLEKECDSKEKAYNDCYCEYKHYKQFESIPKKKIEDKIKEIKENISYLSKFNDWKEKEYTNEDITNYNIEVLQELLEKN